MKIIEKIKGWLRPSKKEKKLTLKEVSEVFGIMERMQGCGMLSWSAKEKRLFVAEPLAVVQLRNREAWGAFMKNVMMWTIYKRQAEAWEKAFVAAEAKAIRAAKRKKAVLSKAETERIRRSAREGLAGADSSNAAVKVPKVEGFEVFIIADNNDGSNIIAVGKYDAETERTDMVMWDEIDVEGLKSKGEGL